MRTPRRVGLAVLRFSAAASADTNVPGTGSGCGTACCCSGLTLRATSVLRRCERFCAAFGIGRSDERFWKRESMAFQIAFYGCAC